jgi:hypothetical protein
MLEVIENEPQPTALFAASTHRAIEGTKQVNDWKADKR